MDIDAAWLDKKFKTMTFKSRSDVVKAWQQELKGRCRGCGSKDHDQSKHSDETCRHCGGKGHYGHMCLKRYQETYAPKTQSIRATDTSSTASASSSTDDRDAQFAALQDTVALQAKQMETLMEQLRQKDF